MKSTFIEVIVDAVAVLLLISVVLFIKTAFFDHRPQKFGLLLAIVAMPLYALHYNDRPPFDTFLPDDPPGSREYPLRNAILPLEQLPIPGHPDFSVPTNGAGFESSVVPALLIGLLMLVRTLVFQRVAVRERLQRLHDPIANFFALASVLTLVGGVLVSTYDWGWIGGIVVTVVFSLVYLGVLALVAAIIEVTLEVSRLIAIWFRRRIFSLATRITRVASWVSSLSGRLVSRSMIEGIRADVNKQESLFMEEQESQDRKLEAAYLRDREKRRQAMQRRARKLERMQDGDEPGIPQQADSSGLSERDTTSL